MVFPELDILFDPHVDYIIFEEALCENLGCA